MIELILLNYLSSHLDIPVYMEEPEDPPVAYLIIEKTGSTKNNQIETSMVAIQSYGETLYDASVLNDKVKRLVETMIELPEVGSAKLNSDYNYTDPETKRYRYQCVYNIVSYQEV